MTRETTVLLDGLGFPEGPRWHQGKLWFSDQETCRVMRVKPSAKLRDARAEFIAEVPGQPSGLGWLPDGRLLIVSMKDRRLLRLDPDGPTEVADLRRLASYHCNDMVVDRRGRAYVGHFGYDISDPSANAKLAEILLVTPDGRARVVVDELAFPNGIVITPDGGTLIVAETFAARLSAFDIAPDGSLGNRRTWARFDKRGFEDRFDTTRTAPDGICLDAEGALWVASPFGSQQVLRVLEGGEVVDRIDVATQPFAAMLGGPDRRTLCVCTSVYGEQGLGKGRIETVRVDVPGAGRP